MSRFKFQVLFRDHIVSKGKTKEGNTCAARVVTSAAYGELEVVHHREFTSCFIRMGLLYEKWAVPALESDCRKSDRVFHVSNHLLNLIICIDRYQMYIRILGCKHTENFVGKRLPNRIHIVEIKNNLLEIFQNGLTISSPVNGKPGFHRHILPKKRGRVFL